MSLFWHQEVLLVRLSNEAHLIHLSTHPPIHSSIHPTVRAYCQPTGSVLGAREQTRQVPAPVEFSANDNLPSWVSGRVWGSNVLLGV